MKWLVERHRLKVFHKFLQIRKSYCESFAFQATCYGKKLQKLQKLQMRKLSRACGDDDDFGEGDAAAQTGL